MWHPVVMDAWEVIWRTAATIVSLGVGFVLLAILTNNGR